MKRILFFLSYMLTPLPPVLLYMRSLGTMSLDGYTVSVLLGIMAITFISNQFIMAARPRLAIRALGLQGLLAFHGIMAMIIVLLALVHMVLKLTSGFPASSLQAILGIVILAIFAVVVVLAVLFLAKVPERVAPKARALRARAKEKFGLDYERARAYHNISVGAGLGILVHALLAYSSDFTVNPIGSSWLIAWMGLSLGLYARYRIRGRKFSI